MMCPCAFSRGAGAHRAVPEDPPSPATGVTASHHRAIMGRAICTQRIIKHRTETALAQAEERSMEDVVQDVERHVEENGPWQYKFSQLYEAPENTAAVENIAAEKHAKIAA